MAASDTPDRQPSAYCTSTTPRVIRLTAERYAVTLAYNRFVRIGAHLVAEEVSIGQNGKPRAAMHVTSFKTAPTLKDADFALPESAGSSAETVVLPSAVQTGKLVTKVPPRYPEEARITHVSGTVTLGAIIDRAGKIRTLDVISTSSDLLVKESLEAVRQWTYTPYLVNGQPVEVETTVTVNFAFTH